jgi:hypothetical protein
MAIVERQGRRPTAVMLNAIAVDHTCWSLGLRSSRRTADVTPLTRLSVKLNQVFAGGAGVLVVVSFIPQ